MFLSSMVGVAAAAQARMPSTAGLVAAKQARDPPKVQRKKLDIVYVVLASTTGGRAQEEDRKGNLPLLAGSPRASGVLMARCLGWVVVW